MQLDGFLITSHFLLERSKRKMDFDMLGNQGCAIYHVGWLELSVLDHIFSYGRHLLLVHEEQGYQLRTDMVIHL